MLLGAHGSAADSILFAAAAGPTELTIGGAVIEQESGNDAWTSLSNVIVDSDSYGYAAMTSAIITTNDSNRIGITSFGFAIPTGKTIDGIEAVIRRKADITGDNVYDEDLLIIKGGVNGATQMADTATAWTTTWTEITYGSPTNLWGETWTVADINANNFGIAFSSQNKKGEGNQSIQAQVAWIKIKVYWS